MLFFGKDIRCFLNPLFYLAVCIVSQISTGSTLKIGDDMLMMIDLMPDVRK